MSPRRDPPLSRAEEIALARRIDKPEDLRKYPRGSILAGGNSPPLAGNYRSPQADWVETTPAFRAVAM